MSFLPKNFDLANLVQDSSTPSSSTASTDPTQQNQIDYSQLLPSAGQISQFAPLSYQNFGSIPQVQASTINMPEGMQAATINQNTLPGALQEYSGLVQSQLNPTFQAQDQQLQAQLASNGLFNSTAANQAETNLQGQQAAALSAGISPLVQNFANYYQQDVTGNAANQQAANAANYQGGLDVSLANQQALNNASDYNANAYGGVVQGNQNLANTYLQGLNTQQNNLQGSLLSAALGTYDPNTNGSTGLLSTGLSNAGNAYNQAYAAAGQNAGTLTNGISNALNSFLNPTNNAATNNYTNAALSQQAISPSGNNDANAAYIGSLLGTLGN